MKRIDKLDDAFRVVPFDKIECAPTSVSNRPLFTWQQFYRLRNELLSVLNRYGTSGPSGELPILSTWRKSEEAWKAGADNPDFFVVSDMYNNRDRWHRVEASPSLVSAPLLTDIAALLMSWPDWCIYLAITIGGLTIFRDRILYEGTAFDGATSLADLVSGCRRSGRGA